MMSMKEKRKSGVSAPVVQPKSKRAKVEHTQSTTTKTPATQKKFERKQQHSTKATKASNTDSSKVLASRPVQKREKAKDERPVKVPKHKKPAQDPSAEFEWDSDPIEESETGEESGADDGVSWPSDGEEDGADGYDELMEDDGNVEDNEADDDEDPAEDDGGVTIAQPKSDDKAGMTKSNGTSSREAHQKQKELLKERRAAKPNADEIIRSKKLWERLRRSSHVPKDERKKLIKELFELITGRVREFVLKHDAGRVIQTALKYGIPEQRKMIARELAGEMSSLAESKYAKFMIVKLVSYGDDEIRDLIVPDFYGKVRRLIRHPEASWILDDIYRGAATKEQKARLLREWYGAEFALFAGKSTDAVGTSELKEILNEQPQKRKHIMRYLWEMINLLVQKKTTGFTMLHDAMLQYYLNVEPGSEEANEFLELLKGDEEYDLMKNLAFTPSGSRVVSLAFAYGTAKDRKLLLRAYKDTVQTMAFDPLAHQVLIAACEVIDDTVLIAKSVFSELLPKDLSKASEQQLADLTALASDKNGREVILLPFIDRQIAFLRPGEQERLRELHVIRESTSRKEPSIRKKELAKSLSAPLLQLIQQRAAELIQSSFGCIFIAEIITRAEGDKEGAMEAVVQLTETDDEAAKLALESSAGGKLLKTLVQGGRFDIESKKVILNQPQLHFVDKLFDRVGIDNVVEWSTGPMAFVVLAMLETGDWRDSKKQKEVQKRLREHRKQLESTAKVADAAKAAKGKKTKNAATGGAAVDSRARIGGTGAKMILAALA